MYKSLIMLHHYYQILDSVFSSTCFLSVSTDFVFILIKLTDHKLYWYERMHLNFWVKKKNAYNIMQTMFFHPETEVHMLRLMRPMIN